MHFKESYQRLVTNDRKRSMLALSGQRSFTDSFDAQLHATLQREQYDRTRSSFDERAYGVSLAWKPGRAFFLSASYDRIKRTGDTSIPSYDETQTWLRVGYAHGSVAAMSVASSLNDATAMDAAAALERDLGFWE
jgi:hypothetical protein